MAQAPMATAAPTDPMAGAIDPGMAGGGDETGDQSSDVVVTICKTDDGSYMVYAGDEPDADANDAPAGGGMAAAAPQGTPVDSVGAALKAAMDILQADASSAGAPGSADDQLAAGYNAPTAPTPASGPSSKY